MTFDLNGWAALGGMAVSMIGFFFKLQSKTERQDEKIAELSTKLKEDSSNNKIQTEKVESTFYASIEHLAKALEQSNKNIQDLTISVARMMERLDHTNKKVLDISAKELKDYLDR